MPKAPGKFGRLPKPPAAGNTRASSSQRHRTVQVISILNLREAEWAAVVQYLTTADVVRLAATCSTLRKLLRPLASDGNNAEDGTADARVRSLPDGSVKPEMVGPIVTAYPQIRFGYTCKGGVSGTFWSASAKEFQVVSMLPQFGGLHQVSLVECDDVIELEALAGVRSVALNRCNNVVDVRPLAAARVLRVEWCLNLTTVAELPRLTELTVDRCPRLAGLDGLATCTALRALTLRKCRNVRSLGGLAELGLQTLRLEQLHNVSDLAPAAGVQQLVCKDLPAVRDVTPVLGVPEVTLIKCRAIRTPVDLAEYPNVSTEASTGAPFRKTSTSSDLSVDDAAAAADLVSLLGSGEGTPVPDAFGSAAGCDSGNGGGSPADGAVAAEANDKVRVQTTSDDWIAEARDLQQARGVQQRAQQQHLQERLEQIAREKRLAEFERLDAERQERELREAEERFEFEETHIRAAERRRLNSAARVEQQAAAEAAVRARVEADAAALRDQSRKMAEDREARKARIRSMVARVRTSGK